MNLTVLKSPAFWVSLVTVVGGLMISSGLVLDGTTVNVVIGWVLSVAGVIGGHKMATPTAPAELPPTT